MPFVAINPNGDRVCSLDAGDLRKQYKPGDFCCQLCAAPMIYKHGHRVRPHFAHKSLCTSDYEHKGESIPHLFGKEAVRDEVLRKYGTSATVELEVPFPDIKRIADVVVTINGWPEVHEIQFSPVGVEQLEERTADYERAGIPVYWWLGGKCQSQVYQSWSQERFGEVNTIQVVDK